MNKLITAILTTTMMLAVLAPTIGATHGGYDEHAPIACVDGVLVTTYEGRAYDPSGVTGTGTEADPYTISTVQIDLADYGEYPAGILIVNCPHVRIVDTQTYGDIGRDPACVAPEKPGGADVQPGEVATYAVKVVDSTDVILDNTVIKAGRLVGVLFENSTGQVIRSDVKANFGTGLMGRGNATTLNATDSFVSFNGFFAPPDRTMRGERPVYEWAAGAWSAHGAKLEIFNTTLRHNVNQLVVDKEVVVTTDAVANLNSLEVNYWRDAVVAITTLDVTVCTDPTTPGWVGPGQVEEPWAPEGFAMAAAWSPVGARAAAAPVAVPNPLAGPDATADPVGTINARLNYWGQMEGPSVNDVTGSVDTKLWLSVPPPGAMAAGALRSADPEVQHDVESVLSTVSLITRRFLP